MSRDVSRRLAVKPTILETGQGARTMNTRIKFRLALGVLACALFFISSMGIARATSDELRRRMVTATSPVTLADGQTFRVTYLNVGSNPFEIVPCIFDGDGTHLKDSSSRPGCINLI